MAALKDLATADLYDRVFERYLAICNEAIEENKDKSPYREIWGARWDLGKENVFPCAVYDDRPEIVYHLRLAEDMKIRITKKTDIVPEDAWPFKFSYLKHVVDHPQDYIRHPANLDWGWLADVLG
jgi:hypothetical protein